MATKARGERRDNAQSLTRAKKTIDNPNSSLAESRQRTGKCQAFKFFNKKQPISVGV